MTDEMKRIPEDAPDWTIPDDTAQVGRKGLPRRTVLLGAAWSVPVISASIATPLAAASTPELELTFVDGPYQAIACGPLDDIVVRATNGGAPAPGEPITVTLPAGLTWSDGTTAPRTLVSDANGEIVLSGVLAGNANGNYALGAVSGAATAASSAEVQGADRGVISQFGGVFLPQLPAGVLVEDVQTNVTADGSMYADVLGSDGNVYRSTKAAGSNTWTAWQKSPTPLGGSVEHLALPNTGNGGMLASTTTVGVFGGATSVPLPGGATIVDFESYESAPGQVTAVVVANNGRVYTSVFSSSTGTYSGWVVDSNFTNATDIAAAEGNTGAVAANSTRVAVVGAPGLSPVLPNGATIKEMSATKSSAGMFVSVLGSDGRAYSIQRTASGWGTWQNSASPLNGSMTQVATSNTAGFVYVSSGNRAGLFGSPAVTPPLPNGATIVDMQGSTINGNQPVVTVLGSDGRAYNSVFQNGAWTPWGASRVGQGKLEHIAVSEGQAWTLVAGNPIC